MIFSSTIYDLVELALGCLIIACLSPIFGRYLAQIYTGKRTILHPLLERLELLSYRLCGINSNEEMTWWNYAKALFWFNLFGIFFLFLLFIFQDYFPLNPQNLPPPSWDLAINTSISFVTNTNWQAYPGETTLSYFSQMVGLASQNFLSAATGLATLLALIRGLTRKEGSTVGNFWVDVIRSILYVFIPLAILFSLLFVFEGSVQSFNPNLEVTTLENRNQIIPLGPVASQIAISQLGSNGGGFFSASTSHPFENPSSISNLLQIIAMLVIPVSIIYTFGILINSKSHAFLLFAVMGVIFVAGFSIALFDEKLINPIFDAYPNLEGKEVRLGVSTSVFWAGATTATSTGSTNSMISSLTPLASGVALFNILLGECIFGGVGVGLCSMLMFVLMTVFLCALMVGRAPEYLGKKIETREIQWVALAVLAPSALTLIGSGISFIFLQNLGALNSGPHGLTEVLYAFASAAGNNGSAMGLDSNTIYYNIFLAIVMLAGRISILLPSLAVAGLLVKKNITPPSVGTFSSNSVIFALLLINIILTVAALSFFPAFTLGPVAEQLLMRQGRTF